MKRQIEGTSWESGDVLVLRRRDALEPEIMICVLPNSIEYNGVLAVGLHWRDPSHIDTPEINAYSMEEISSRNWHKIGNIHDNLREFADNVYKELTK